MTKTCAIRGCRTKKLRPKAHASPLSSSSPNRPPPIKPRRHLAYAEARIPATGPRHPLRRGSRPLVGIPPPATTRTGGDRDSPPGRRDGGDEQEVDWHDHGVHDRALTHLGEPHDWRRQRCRSPGALDRRLRQRHAREGGTSRTRGGSSSAKKRPNGGLPVISRAVVTNRVETWKACGR